MWKLRRLNSVNACYHSVQNPLSSCLSKNIVITIHKTKILPLVLYGWETWSLAIREEHRPRLFENRVLRRIVQRKRGEVTGGSREPHNEELYNLWSSPSIITTLKMRKTRWAGHVARIGDKRHAYRLLVGEPGGKRPLRPRCRLVDNIKADLR
jgi:hypothetical protein